jgi:lysophospholipase L1-like esterase
MTRYRVLLAVSALLATLLFISRPALSATAPVRIMPLGDSITGSPGCWRATLWNRLQSNGFSNIDFVGTLPPQGCAVPYDGDNEGHGGILATNMANQSQLPPWLAATRPDIVIMHLGTNDVWNNLAPATILAAYSTLVDQMRASNPAMKILVAQILPMNPSNCTECGQRVVALNAAIPGWAAGKSTAQSPIAVVDQWTGFSTATDTADGVHPNDSGNQKMSDRWYPALTQVLSPGPVQSGSPTPAPVPGTSTTPPARGACAAAYQITGSWSGGFQGQVTISNSGTTTLTGWTAAFAYAHGQQISQFWGTQLSQSAAAVTAQNLSWNGTLAPGATATFGFIASWTTTNEVPAVTCTGA